MSDTLIVTSVPATSAPACARRTLMVPTATAARVATLTAIPSIVTAPGVNVAVSV